MARQPAQVKSDKPLSRRILVVIDRDMTAKTAKVIWQHEKPIIEAVFGEGKVIEVDPSSLDEGYTDKISPALLPYNKTQDTPPRPSDAAGIGFVFVGDPRGEFDRLAACYGKLAEENVLAVEHIFGRFQEGRFTSVLGGATLEDLPDAQLRSLCEAYGVAPAGAHRDMSDSQKDEAAAARKSFLSSDRDALVKMAVDGGVQLG